MHLSCALLLLMLALNGQDSVCAGRIFGGKEAKAHSRPYMVLVKRTMENNQTKYCGGFLVSEDFVITAAHCQASSYNVSLGLHNYQDTKNTQVIPVEQSFMREDYDSQTMKNDLLLLKLSSKADLNSFVKPITLAGPEDTAPHSCSISGWGRSDDYPDHNSPNLMEVDLTLSDKEPCTKEYFYCCKGKKGNGAGDSGGPRVCEDGRAYGVVSYTYMVSGEPVAHYFAKIPKYKDWIDSIMKK